MQQLLAGPHRLVRRHLVGDVHELGPHVAVGGVVEQVVVRDLQPHPRAVPAPVPQPDAIALAGPGQHLHPALHRPLAVVGVDELERALAHHLLRCPAEHLGRRPVDGHQHRELVLARGREARDDGRHVGKAVQHIARGTVLGEHHQDEHSVMRSDVECPSLSPDGTLLVFKKPLQHGVGWRLHVLELASGTERPLNQVRESVDDQVDWFDNGQVVYHESASEGTGIWVLPVDGITPPRLLLPHAYSPAVSRN